MTASEYYNFRVRANQWVEVIVHAVREDEDLRWVMEGNYDISLSTDQYGEKVIHEDGRITRGSQTGKVIPEVYLVPIARLGRSRRMRRRAVAGPGSRCHFLEGPLAWIRSMSNITQQPTQSLY
jgi:hypothetical protein